jgi:hypothetical protein
MKLPHKLDDEAFDALLREAASLDDAPPALLHKVYALAKAPQTAPMQTLAATASAFGKSITKTLQAALTFDSWTTSPAALGLRSTTMETRQMMFSAPGRDFDVRVTPKGESFVLGGQILGDFGAGSISLSIDTHLRDQPTTTYGLPLDELGSFRIASLPPGLARLMFTLDEETITLPAFEIRKRA